MLDPIQRRRRNPADRRVPDRRHYQPDLTKLQGWKAARAEADIPETRWDQG